MGAVAAVAGAGIGAWGASKSASAADKKRRELRSATNKWLPDIDAYTERYFNDLLERTPEATRLADTIGMSDIDRAMRMREKAMPGFQKGTQSAFESLMPLLRGELPPAVMEAFQRAGGASSVGSGFGGSGFGMVNQGLFGARGALGAMQTGYGLLPALMSTLPNVNTPSSMAFLESIMTPAQRTQAQLQVRGQNMQNAIAGAGMPRGGEIMGGFLQQTGGALMGAGMSAMSGGMGGMGGGGGGGTKYDISAEGSGSFWNY